MNCARILISQIAAARMKPCRSVRYDCITLGKTHRHWARKSNSFFHNYHSKVDDEISESYSWPDYSPRMPSVSVTHCGLEMFSRCISHSHSTSWQIARIQWRPDSQRPMVLARSKLVDQWIPNHKDRQFAATK
jgi:hypothetical protein